MIGMVVANRDYIWLVILPIYGYSIGFIYRYYR